MAHNSDKTTLQSRQVFAEWLESCRRGGTLARSTMAIGIVVLDHLRRECPTSKDKALSARGEVRGARSDLGGTLETYGIPRTLVRETADPQGHQDGLRLLEALDWGNQLLPLSAGERDALLSSLIAALATPANLRPKRQNLKLLLDKREAPAAWVHTIMQTAADRSWGVVEQHLVGATLERRFKTAQIPNRPARPNDKQTSGEGDFPIRTLVYHVAANPRRNDMQKCRSDLAVGKHPVLIVPTDHENKTRVLAQDEGIDTQISLFSIENFVAFKIMHLAIEEKKKSFTVLKEIVEIYNRRLKEVETDLSLQIEIQ
ncbi:MAG: DUF4928 family protein [Chloroflexi bacterium]|nr:DUF4928 family protein [Chloroflexota bacterium]